MIVQLKLVLDCEPDAAWHALQSPAGLREVASPWLDFASLEPEGLPTQWPNGEHLMRALALRTVQVGTVSVDISRPGGLPREVRMLRDTGGLRGGLGRGLHEWDHRMAVSPTPGGTLYRDRLRFRGRLAGASWYPIWLFWQWRGLRLRQLAPTWSFDAAPLRSPPASAP
ncbi:hypothetical protein [Microterricola pindariensis]|uniref:SRPBCC family protein n=1 Tax=Microterricola pindariensis TaxID=478010 RepID=A0ABX5AYX6_9MICO|nr:hypothetical protein [Microterricola pindariensis]PPL20097.1 hypothetical protein GY24_03060 [Microterricola pindariensis]